jgi:hypothetical protein
MREMRDFMPVGTMGVDARTSERRSAPSEGPSGGSLRYRREAARLSLAAPRARRGAWNLANATMQSFEGCAPSTWQDAFAALMLAPEG